MYAGLIVLTDGNLVIWWPLVFVFGGFLFVCFLLLSVDDLYFLLSFLHFELISTEVPRNVPAYEREGFAPDRTAGLGEASQ